ncbi:MAG TPA: hypothetical protein VFK92_09775 [Burkholderiales bacterium]|nr:hypothetical protein [Burkholderiales bacterium]
MDKEKLSPKEEALLAEARREALARKEAQPAEPQPPKAAAKATPAERLARLMEAERAETLERKKKMRRYGIGISAAILALFALWVLRASRRR